MSTIVIRLLWARHTDQTCNVLQVVPPEVDIDEWAAQPRVQRALSLLAVEKIWVEELCYPMNEKFCEIV